MSDNLSFDSYKPQREPEIMPHAYQQAPIPDYYQVNAGGAGAFPRAVLFGIGGAIVGCLLYALFTIVTHIEIGYVALGVGYLVGKAMMAGSGRRGGRNYQIAAAILTYLSVSFASIVEALWSLHGKGVAISDISAQGWSRLAGIGVIAPFLDIADNTFGGLIGLFILFIGIRAAWRLTSASTATASHPFTP